VRQLYFLEEPDHGPDHETGICNHLGDPLSHHRVDSLLVEAWAAVLYLVCHLDVVPTLVDGHLLGVAVEEEHRSDGLRGVGNGHHSVDDMHSCLRFQSRRAHLLSAHLPNFLRPFPPFLLSVLVVEQPSVL